MGKKFGYKVVKLLMNLVFVYFILFGVMVFRDSKARPELYSIVKPPQSNNPITNSLVPNFNDIIEENKQLKNMYWHWLDIYKTFIYPMLLFILGLFVIRLLMDNSELIGRMDDG